MAEIGKGKMSEKIYDKYCFKCKLGGGSLLFCQFGDCLKAYHAECLKRSLTCEEVPKVIHSKPTVDGVFDDFVGRRLALIKALTTDVDDFFLQCDPGKGKLLLLGYPNGMWIVDEYFQDVVPPEIPEPVRGINLTRDVMSRKNWLSHVANYCDSWLLSVAYFFARCFEFDQTERMNLFEMINKLVTVSEAVNAEFNPLNDQPCYPSSSDSNVVKEKPTLLSEEVGEVRKDGDELCGVCRKVVAANEFWKCCDVCQIWFHSECVEITPAEAELIEVYKCPTCYSSKRA